MVLVLEMLESGFKTRKEIETKLGLPVIGTVPDLASLPGTHISKGDSMGPANYLVANEGSLFGEAFRSIRTALRLGHASQHARSVAICSALPDEGKTTISICLARSAALAGLKVVLVDCDVRRRVSSRSMAGEVKIGLVELLKGTVALDDVLVRDSASGAWILPHSSEGDTGYDLLTTPTMEALVATLAERLDLVVLDTAPVLPLAEARAVASMADAVLLVTRWRKTPVNAAELALSLLGRAGAKVTGVVMSVVNIKQQTHGAYGDEMMYYKKFKNYYS